MEDRTTDLHHTGNAFQLVVEEGGRQGLYCATSVDTSRNGTAPVPRLRGWSLERSGRRRIQRSSSLLLQICPGSGQPFNRNLYEDMHTLLGWESAKVTEFYASPWDGSSAQFREVKLIGHSVARSAVEEKATRSYFGLAGWERFIPAASFEGLRRDTRGDVRCEFRRVCTGTQQRCKRMEHLWRHRQYGLQRHRA